MPFTHRQRQEAQRDGHTELYLLARSRRDDLLKDKAVPQYEPPIKAARTALLQTKVILEAEGLQEE